MRITNGIICGVTLVGLFAQSPAVAQMWKCTAPDGGVTYQDGGGHGCREVTKLPDLQSTGQLNLPGTVDGPTTQWEEIPVRPRVKKSGPVLSTRPFVPASRVVPSLSYHDVHPAWKARGWSMPNKGDLAMVQIDVDYWPAGNGPYLDTDQHFKGTASQAFGRALLAAAKAVQYDARFIRARLSMPVGTIFHTNLRTDGPSAGVAWAVAIAAGLLGDAIRPDVCLSGTMDTNFVVGPVGGLEHKVEGCHLLPQFHELLVPAGQRTLTLTDKGMGYGIKVTEVATLSDAYEIATGQPLRPAP